jgi:uncharacterized membrane protein
MPQQRSQQKLSDIPVTTNRLNHLANKLKLAQSTQQRAFTLAKLKPDPQAWLQFVDNVLLIVGVTMVIVGVMAFFAYNWADMHKFAKFALIELALVATVIIAYLKGLETLPGKAALFGAAVMTGVLLAVYGQTYQTGADPYGLFLTWALLISGWVLIGRNGGLWLLLLVLLNLSLIMYWTQIVHPQDWRQVFANMLGPFAGITFSLTDFALAQWVFAMNVTALILWEFMSQRGVAWMNGRIFPRIIAVFALLPIVVSTFLYIVTSGSGNDWGVRFLSPVFFAVFTIASLYYFSRKHLDLFILAAGLLAVIVVVTTLLAHVMGGDFEMFIILGLVIIAQSAAAAQWLRKVKTAGEAIQ